MGNLCSGVERKLPPPCRCPLDTSPVRNAPPHVRFDRLVPVDGVESVGKVSFCTNDSNVYSCFTAGSDATAEDAAAVIITSDKFASLLPNGSLVTPAQARELAGQPGSLPGTPVPFGARVPPPRRPLPAGMAAGVTSAPCECVFVDSICGDWYSPEHIAHLRRGGLLFGMHCCVGEDLSDDERYYLSQVLAPSCFADEQEANGVPEVNMDNKKHLKKYIFMLQRSCYILPAPLTSADVGKEVLSNVEFRRNTEPGKPKFWDNDYVRSLPDTYCMTKTIIPLLYSIDMQFRLSEIADVAQKQSLSHVVAGGLPPSKCVLYERTKRDKTDVDFMRKSKMVQLFHDLPDGGVLVCAISGLVVSSVPKVLAGIASRLIKAAGKDFAETATNTRAELLQPCAGVIAAQRRSRSAL